MDEQSFDEQLRRLAELGDKLDALNAERKELDEEYEDLSWKLAMYMDQTGCGSKKLDDRNFIKASRTFAKVEDKAVLTEWINTNNMHDVLMAINAQKINGFCNECLQNGTEIPPGVSPGYVKHYVQIRRA